jgi:hypothetical protein
MGEKPVEHDSSSLSPSMVGGSHDTPKAALAAALSSSLGERRCCIGLGLLLGWIAAHIPL